MGPTNIFMASTCSKCNSFNKLLSQIPWQTLAVVATYPTWQECYNLLLLGSSCECSMCRVHTYIYTIFTIHISTPKYYHCSPQVKKRWLMQSKIKYSFQVEKNFIGNLHTKHSQCYYVLLTSLTPKRMYGIMHVRHSILRTILLKNFGFALSLLSCFSSSTLHPRRCLLACNLTS